MRLRHGTRGTSSSRGRSRTKSTAGAYLPKSDFIHEAPSKVGEQVRINHVNCPQGMDTRRRLYVKRISPSRVVAFCHNCGCKGSASTAAQMIRAKLIQHVYDSSLPDDLVHEIPLHYRAYLYKYRFTDAMIAKYGIMYSPLMDRLVFPVRESGKLVGWAARSNTEQPKWIYPKNFNKAEYLVGGFDEVQEV